MFSEARFFWCESEGEAESLVDEMLDSDALRELLKRALLDRQMAGRELIHDVQALAENLRDRKIDHSASTGDDRAAQEREARGLKGVDHG